MSNLKRASLAGQGPRSKPGCNWAHDHLLLLLLRLALLVLLALLILLLLLISRPGKGGIPIIFPMSRLKCPLLLHRTSGTLLLRPSYIITPATTGRNSSLTGRHILSCLLAADILVSMADTSQTYL
jgi:hypothetical protein